jgi:predicted nuclease with TOPRIM domain
MQYAAKMAEVREKLETAQAQNTELLSRVEEAREKHEFAEASINNLSLKLEDAQKAQRAKPYRTLLGNHTLTAKEQAATSMNILMGNNVRQQVSEPN